MTNEFPITNDLMPNGRSTSMRLGFGHLNLVIHWSLGIGHWSLVIFITSLLGSTSLAAVPSDPTLQTDANWIDDRWQKTDVGPFLSACIQTPRQKTCKGIAIKVGDNAE